MPNNDATKKPPLRPSKIVDVLLVDDEDAICRVLSRALRRKGLSVDSVSSALHAIRALEAATYRVVVSDQRMPGPAGSLLLTLVAIRWPKARLILMSAWIHAALLGQCPAVHRVVDKSFPLARIVEVIMEEVSRAKGP